jgi:hypothetical protein
MSLKPRTLAEPILETRMRTILALGLLAALFFVPAAISDSAKQQPQDGCLVVSGGNGTISVWGQGGVIGRMDQGTLTVQDMSGPDAAKPKVYGNDPTGPIKIKNGTVYQGSPNLRFRVTGGGSFHFTITGIHIDLSVIGQGRAVLNGGGYQQEGGSFSADAASLCVDNVKAFPTVPTKVVLGAPGSG